MTEKLLYTDPKAAEYKTVQGWVGADGRFWGKDEHMARWSACTHLVCECGKDFEKRGWTKCENCREKYRVDQYAKMPFKKWDLDTPVCLYENEEQFFFCVGDLEDYIENNNIDPKDLRLLLCEPRYAQEINEDYYCDDLPEDHSLNDVAPELAAMIEEVNKYIREEKPLLSWWASNYRTEYKPGEQS